MKLIEMPHLAVGSPRRVATPGVSQIEVGDLLDPRAA
jgi:hypothetical protein